MKKLYLLTFLLCCCALGSQAQRTLEIVSDSLDNPPFAVSAGGTIYAIASGDHSLISYDGTTLRNTPLSSSGTLHYSTGILPHLVSNGSTAYILLYNMSSGNTGVFKCSPTSLTMLPFPGTVISNIVIYRDNVYALVRTSAGIRLCYSNGISVTTVSGSAMPESSGYSLVSGGLNLYIRGTRVHTSDTAFLKRYNGVSVSTISTGDIGHREMTSAYDKPGGTEAYICFQDGGVTYYNGASLSTVYYVEGYYPRGFTLLHGDLYFTSVYESDNATLYKLSGPVLTEITPPAGTFVSGSSITVYRGYLTCTIRNGTTISIYRFDGALFTELFEAPTTVYSPKLQVRAGKLLFIPAPVNLPRAYEYDGVDVVEIQSPHGEWLVESEASTPCLHAWTIGDVVYETGHYYWQLAFESIDSCPTSGGGGTVAVIPGKLRPYERFEIAGRARERDWCWTGIDVDWDIHPICPVLPCPVLPFVTTLTDLNGKIAWEKTFDKPFSATLPAGDTQPYTFSLSVLENQIKNNVLVLGNDLVNKGIENVSFDMYPKDNYFYLTVDTEKGVSVPLTLKLMTNKGTTVWQKDFTAPMDETIYAFAAESGDFLQLSLAAGQKSNVTYYPNPVNGKLSIDTRSATSSVSISLKDMNGTTVLSKDKLEPGISTFDVSAFKSGLYVLTLMEGKSTTQQLIELK